MVEVVEVFHDLLEYWNNHSNGKIGKPDKPCALYVWAQVRMILQPEQMTAPESNPPSTMTVKPLLTRPLFSLHYRHQPARPAVWNEIAATSRRY